MTTTHTTFTATECWELTTGWTEQEIIDMAVNGIIDYDEMDFMLDGRSLVEARAAIARMECGCEICAAVVYESRA